MTNSTLKIGSKGREVEKLQVFLEKQNILKISARISKKSLHPFELDKKNIGLFEETTENALKSYQNFLGLKPDGIWDKVMHDFPTNNFCAENNLISFEVDLTGVLSKPTLYINEKTTFTYAVIGAPSILSENKIEIREETERHKRSVLAAERACALWTLETGIRFKKAPETKADITIRFVPQLQSIGNALIELNDSHSWGIGPSLRASYDLVSVMAHEIGHNLGLHHQSNSLMDTDISLDERFEAITSVDIKQLRDEGYERPHLLQIIGTNGTAIHTEFPENLEIEQRLGPHTSVLGKAGHTNWFHYSFSHTLIGPHNRPYNIHAVRLRLRTFSSIQVQQVDVFDAERKLTTQLLYFRKSGINIWDLHIAVPEKQQILHGVGVSIKILFTNGSNSRIDWLSATAELTQITRLGIVSTVMAG